MGDACTTSMIPQQCLNTRVFIGSSFATIAQLICVWGATYLSMWYLYAGESDRTVRGCKEIARRSFPVCYCTTVASWRIQSEMSCILFFTKRVELSSIQTEIMAKWISVITKYLWKNAAGTPCLWLCSPPTNELSEGVFNMPVSINDVLFFPLLLVPWYGNVLREEGNSFQVLVFFFWVM